MSLRLIKPGLSVADLTGRVHPRTGTPIEPLGYRKDGRPIWPVMGGDGSDDPDDPRFTNDGGESDDDTDDEDESEEDDDDTKSRKKPVKKTVKSKKRRESDEDDDDDEDEEDEEDDAQLRSREAMKYRRRLRAQEEENRKLQARLRKLEDKERKPEEIEERDKRERAEAEAKRDKEIRQTRIENAFLHAAGRLSRQDTPIEFVDHEDALAVGERLGLFDDVLDDDGTVDRKAMARALRELAKRKPHLVVKPRKARGQADDEDEDDDDQGSTSTPTMNGKRKGRKTGAPDKAALAKKFPALNRV